MLYQRVLPHLIFPAIFSTTVHAKNVERRRKYAQRKCSTNTERQTHDQPTKMKGFTTCEPIVSIIDRLEGSKEHEIYVRKYPLADILISEEDLTKYIRDYLGHNPAKGRTVQVLWDENGEWVPRFTIILDNGLNETFSYQTRVKPIEIVRRALRRNDIDTMYQDEGQQHDQVISLKLKGGTEYGLCEYCLSNKFLYKEKSIKRDKDSGVPYGPNVRPELQGKNMPVSSWVIITKCDDCNTRVARSSNGYRLSEQQISAGIKARIWTGPNLPPKFATFQIEDFGLKLDKRGVVLSDESDLQPVLLEEE